MKTKITFFSIVSFFIMNIMPVNAQKIEKVNYYNNNPELGGDVIITSSTNEIIEDDSYTSFEIEVESAGEYYLNFWLLPAEYENGSLYTYEVLVNGNNAGTIVPAKGNWQSIGLSNNGKVNLQQGKNTISVITEAPNVVEVEFVRLSKTFSKAKISSNAYDSYLAKAKNRNETGNRLLRSSSEESELDSENILPSSAAANYQLFTNVPLKYSVRQTQYFTAGQQIFISSNSSITHVLELFKQRDNYITGAVSLSWLNVSEPALNNSSVKVASIVTTIPATGYYIVKARSASNNSLGTVSINVNGSYFYQDMPVYYAGRSYQIPAGTNSAVYTFADNTISNYDPFLFIEGAGSIPGKVVAYNDDVYDYDTEIQYGLHYYDSYIENSYSMPTSGMHVTNYSSYNAEVNCHIMVGLAPSSSQSSALLSAMSALCSSNSNNESTELRSSNSSNESSEIANITSVNGIETKVFPNPANISSVLSINSGEDINAIEIYNVSGLRLQRKSINNTSIQISMSELNINKSGVYIVKFIAATGSVTKKLVVK